MGRMTRSQSPAFSHFWGSAALSSASAGEGYHLRAQAMRAGDICMKREVVLSRECSTRLFPRAGMASVMGPAT